MFLTHSFAVAMAFLLAAVGSVQAAEGTRPQHREWMRKFETPAGTLRGDPSAHSAVSLEDDFAEPGDCTGSTGRDRSTGSSHC